MKRCSLFSAGPWPFIFLPLLLLLPLLAFQWHGIEEDVAQNAQAKLAVVGANWATAETFNRGRNVLITGTPPNDAAIKVAIEAVASADGVNSVDIGSDVIPPATPPELKTTIVGERVTLEGVLASQTTVDELAFHAANAFGKGNLVNKLNVNRNTAALPELNDFFVQLSGKSFGREALILSIKGNILTLEGTIKSDASSDELLMQMSQSLGLEVKSSLTIAPPPVKRDVCQELVNDLLANSKINFASAKASIQEESFALLERIKITALRCPDAKFEVSGHTDSVGDLLFNMSLSEQRAAAVVEYLVNLGLNANQFTPAGYGPNKPLTENITLAGRAENRRIEFKLKN